MSPEISLKAGRAVLGAGLSSAVARLIHVVVVASGGALLAGGCVGYSLAPEPAAQALAENGSDLADLAARAAAVTASFASEAPARLELTTLSATGAFYDPTQCFTSQREDQSSSKLEVTFDACNGPWGLSNLSGFLTVEPDSDAGLTPDQQSLKVATQNFRLDDAEVSFEGQAIISSDGTGRVMTWKGNINGVTSRERAFQTYAELTLTWQLGGTCITIHGTTSNGAVFSSSISTVVRDLIRCDSACPEAGEVTIMQTSPPEETLQVSFIDGMDVSDFNAGGESNPIKLGCDL